MSKPMETIVPIEPIEPIVPIEEIERKNLEEEKFLKGVTSISDFENGENGKDTINNDEEIIKKIKDLAEKEIQDIFNDYKNNSILEEPNEQSSLEECDTYAYSKYLILQNLDNAIKFIKEDQYYFKNNTINAELFLETLSSYSESIENKLNIFSSTYTLVAKKETDENLENVEVEIDAVVIAKYKKDVKDVNLDKKTLHNSNTVVNYGGMNCGLKEKKIR